MSRERLVWVFRRFMVAAIVLAFASWFLLFIGLPESIERNPIWQAGDRRWW